MTKNGGVAGYTEYFCYVLSGKLTNEDGSYLFNAVLELYVNLYENPDKKI